MVITKTIYINGRFLTQLTTGVQRVASEVLKSLDEIAGNSSYKFVILKPKSDTFSNINLRNIEIRQLSFFKGHIWEQLTLPLYVKNSLLINLCGPAPIFKSNQIVMIHDAAIYTNSDNFSKTFLVWYKLMFKFLKTFSKKIITVSQFSKNELIKYLKIREDKISIAYLGMEHIIHREVDNSILDRFNLVNKKYLLAVSSKSPNKNFKAIVESLEYLNSKKFEIVIVGTQNNNVFQSKSEVNIDKVIFTGYISDEELKSLYENAACFVYPSFYEGFGLPPIEAMTCGCPVVVSYTSSLKEVCGENAVYCNPYDSKDIANKINSVLESNSIAEMKENNYAHSQNYSWKKTANELLKHIDTINKKGVVKPHEKSSYNL